MRYKCETNARRKRNKTQDKRETKARQMGLVTIAVSVSAGNAAVMKSEKMQSAPLKKDLIFCIAIYAYRGMSSGILTRFR